MFYIISKVVKIKIFKIQEKVLSMNKFHIFKVIIFVLQEILYLLEVVEDFLKEMQKKCQEISI